MRTHYKAGLAAVTTHDKALLAAVITALIIVADKAPRCSTHDKASRYRAPQCAQAAALRLLRGTMRRRRPFQLTASLFSGSCFRYERRAPRLFSTSRLLYWQRESLSSRKSIVTSRGA
jgi:hypothetical protein